MIVYKLSLSQFPLFHAPSRSSQRYSRFGRSCNMQRMASARDTATSAMFSATSYTTSLGNRDKSSLAFSVSIGYTF